MSDIETRQAIIGGDNDVWGPFEQAQNHLAIGANTRYLYMDGADLKLSKGMIGHTIDPTHFANISNTAARIISVAGLTVSLWAKIELSIVAGIVNTTISSIVGANNPAVLPASFTWAYDAIKGGYYEIATHRIVGLVWINAAGVVEGIINCPGGGDGYSGYATSNDSYDVIYSFLHIGAFTLGQTYMNSEYTISKSTSYTILSYNQYSAGEQAKYLTILATRGAAGIRLTLPSVASNAGRMIEIINVDNGGTGCTTVFPNGGTISGMSYVFMTETYQRIKIYCDGANWFIISGVLYWMTGSRNTNDWTNRELGMELLTYDTRAGTILIGEKVTETETGNTWIIIADNGSVLTCINATGTGFATNNNHLTFGQSGATALVNNGTTDKNSDTSMVHATGRNACRFEIEVWVSPNTIFTWTGAVRIGRFSYSNASPYYTNYEAIQVDTNNIKIQTASTFIMVIAEDGSYVAYTNQDYSYNVILKMVF